ncbi:MAG: hypothetical protein Phog2KO_42990 [Phototrophicaceae bacterium]
MSKILRVSSLLFLLLLIALPSSALDAIPAVQQDESDSAAVRIIPNEAEVGNNHTILVTGLSANEPVTVRIIFDDDEREVYETDQVADSRGVVEVSIFTETSDTAGDYTVEVSNASDAVIGSASLLLLEAGQFNTEISIDPLEGEAGTVFNIEITDVRPFVILDVVIDNQDGEEVFSQRLRATVDGNASIEFESSESTTGDLTIVVTENDVNEIAAGQITVLEEIFPATIIIEPNTALPGDTVFVTVSGLESEQAVTVDISLDDENIAIIEETANISGLLIFPYTLPDDAEFSTYTFSILDETVLIGRDTLSVEIPPTEVTISPTVGTVGTIFVATVSGLREGEDVIIDLTADNEVIQSVTATADENGEARAGLGQRIDLELGFYGVQVTRLDTLVFTAPIEVTDERPPTPITINPDNVTISVSPESGSIPTEYTLLVEGLPADTNITLFILFDGVSVLSLSGVSDADGIYTTVITSEASDPPGVYTLEVRAEGNVIGSVDFEIADENASEDDDTSEVPEAVVEGDVSVTVSPEALRQGERIEFFLNNLTPEETVTFELSFDGEVIYTSETTADSNGASALALLAQEDEALGEYHIRILRDTEEIATSSFTIIDSDAVINDASVTVSPETASAGSEYTIVVTGLEAQEDVAVLVTLDGNKIFEAVRSASTDGIVTIVLASNSDDELGTYDVSVVRENSELSTIFTITEADAETATSENDNISLLISPETGVLTSEHEINVTGLDANEAFTLLIEFDGNEVYSAEQTADEDGNFATVIATSDSDDLGDYTIIIERVNADDVSGVLTVVGDEETAETGDFTVSIDKDEVELEEDFEITVSGLDAGESIIIEVEFSGDIVYETVREADTDGIVTLILATDAGDSEGTYSINVLRGDEVISADIVVSGSDEETQVTQDVQLVVNPNSGEIGTEYEFIVTGLNSNENIVIAVEFDGNIVYEAERSADGSGIFTITLATSEDDEAGTYIFRVIREDNSDTNIDFVVEDSGDSELESGNEDEADALTSNPEAEQEDSIEHENSNADDSLSSVVTYVNGLNIVFDSETSVQVIEFDAEAGDVVSINVNSNDSVDTVATLFNPDGVEIASDDDGGVGFDPEIERAVLADTGTYTLEIRTFTTGDSGEAEVTISRSDVRTLDDAVVRTIVLNSKITTEILTFTGEAGDVISLVLSLESGEIGAFVVSAVQDDTVLMNYQTFGLPESITLGFVIPEDGNVTISIEDDGSTSAIINALIERE